MTTRKEFLSKLLPAVVAAPFVTLPETKNTRPEWMTETWRCKECLQMQAVHVVSIRYGQSAIVGFQETHLEQCSRYTTTKKLVSFEL